MPIRTREAAFLVTAWCLNLTTVLATPSLNFPINSQVPPVARVSEPFSFTFAESTFTPSQDPISYSLLSGPSWLHFDPDTRTFFGNATTREVGPTTFDLVASDSSGSTSSEVTLIVADWGGPQQGQVLLPQLSKAGPTSAPASLLLHPLEVFQAIFNRDVFSNTSAATTYYATSADNSPLPSWLHFYPASLRFSGTSPALVSLTAKSQHYGVRLIATDVVGFAEAVTTFQIVVSHQILAFSETSQTVELSQGQKFMTEPLRKDLTLDGMSVDRTALTSVTSNAPSWAKLDTDQIFLSGTPPPDATSQSVLIQVADVHGDTANVTVDLVVLSNQKNLFRNSIAPVNAIVGQDFHYTIESSSLWSSDVHVIADVSNASSWLTYDATSRTFSGSVPDEVQPGTITIRLDGNLGSLTEHSTLVVDVVRSLISPASSRPSQELATSASHPDRDTTLKSDSASKGSHRTLKIVLGVFLPLLFLFCLSCLVLYCCWRRRRQRKNPRQASEEYFSGPVVPSEPERTGATAAQGDQDEKTSTPTSPPRIELPWAPDSLKKSRERLSKSIVNGESTLVDSGWGDLVIRDPAKPAKNSKRIEQTKQDAAEGSEDWTPFVRHPSSNLNYSRKRAPLRPTQSKVQKGSFSSRASKTLSGISTLSVGLPVRLSGAGHGAGGPGPPGFRDVRRSYRNTCDSLVSEDDRTTPIDLDAFPDPPGGRREVQGEQQEQTLKASVRLVSSSSSRSGSLVDRRQKWVKDRARDRHERGSRFSHAWSSRGYPRARGLDSSLRSSSIPVSGLLDPDDLLSRRNTRCSWSQSSSIGAPIKPETWARMKSPDSHLVRHPSNLRRALSTFSSGRFDSAESKSNSSWIDDLIEAEDEDGRRRWVAVDKKPEEDASATSPGLQEGGGESEQGSWGKNSRTGGLGALRANIHGGGPAMPSGERRWRLGDEQAKRPISVEEGDLQRSQGSQRGNLAFV